MPDDFLWWRDGVIYQIYPRSFNDTNHDGLGDLPGITTRLDYLGELGIDAIWLSPIYPSPDVDYGYDVSDYTAIDPRFGTLQDFDTLLVEAHRRGIRVILDLVLNHTSDQHRWFLASRSSRENPYRNWYIWRDPRPGGGPPNNWESVVGGQAWEYDANTRQYYLHHFYKRQPDVNWHNPEVRRAMLDVFRFWLERGVDGFRLDVFNLYFKHPEMPDNPPKMGVRAFDRQQHTNIMDRPEMTPLLAEIRQILDGYPERYAIGETFDNPPEKVASYCDDRALQAAFEFSFLKSRWNPRQFLKVIQSYEKCWGDRAWPTYVLNNHDNTRSSSRYACGENDARLKVAAGLLLTLRGTPYLYYGEEIGMRNISLPRSQILDTVGLRYWPIYKGRDGSRAPMQWNNTIHAGFSTEKPWLPLHPDYLKRNVASQQADPTSLLTFYRTLIHLRRATPALRRGSFTPINSHHQVMAYLRQSLDQTVLVALNFSGEPQPLILRPEIATRQWKLLLSTARDYADIPLNATLVLAPYEITLMEVL